MGLTLTSLGLHTANCEHFSSALYSLAGFHFLVSADERNVGLPLGGK